MRQLGLQKVLRPSTAPVIVAIVFSAFTRKPVYAWAQESPTDVLNVLYDGALVPCKGILDDVSIRSTRPQSGGGLRRNTTALKFNVENAKGYPIFEDPILKSLYYGGSNFDDFYFGIFGIDRQNLNSDIRSGASYGFYKVDNEITWDELGGVQSINLIDILLAQDNIVGATEEKIDDTFFIYNSWYDANFFPKAYGQVPRIKVLNAFPSFGIKNFSAAISGRVRSNYTNVSTTILLEENTDQASLLLQAANIGGTVRIRMKDNEVIAGTLDYDSTAKTITLDITARNTYYNNVAAYNDSLDGRTPDQWGDHPSYVSVRFSPFQTVIPNAKDLILDQNGFMQADIWFFDNAAIAKGYLQTDCVCKIQGLLDQRKDVVIHSFWPDSRFPTWQNQGSISGYYNSTSNTTYLPTDQVPQWGVAGFQFLKFRDTTQYIKLYFNDPSVSVAGSGSVGDQWQMVNIEPDEVDTSCYIRNGFSKFDVDHVYVEGEGKLIKIPSGNITITQSGTFYGLTNLCKIALTATPLDMNIGAKSNIVYVDALYRDGDVLESRSERVLREIIGEDALLTTMVGDNLINLQEDNYLPYIGWIARQETTLTDIIDKICYQCGITLQWRRDTFNIEVVGWNFYAERDVEIVTHVDDPDTTADDDVIFPPAGTYIEVLAPFTDENEMIEATASLKIGKLKTGKYSDGGMEEFIPLYFKATYGDWEDPFYSAVRSSSNRNIKPNERVVEYHFDLINDINSYLFAVGKALSIGHPSGYALAQRSLITDMCMDGCRWESMCPIVFHQFPLISTVDETNAWYNNDGNGALLYPKREDGKHYIMGAVCVVDDVSYEFNVMNPVVKMLARNSQTFVQASGVAVYNPPGAPGVPEVPTDPNTPPNTGGGNGSGGTTVVGNDWLMPHIVTPDPVSPAIINSTDTQSLAFTITVDAGFVFNKGWAYRLFIYTPETGDSGTTLGDSGAELIDGFVGAFPDKDNDSYIPPIYTVHLQVNYLWFNDQSEGTTFKPLQIVLRKRWYEGVDLNEEDVNLNIVHVNRADVTGIEGS